MRLRCSNAIQYRLPDELPVIEISGVATQGGCTLRVADNGQGIRAEILTAEIPPEQRETWYERKIQQGMQVFVARGSDAGRVP